MKIDKMIEFLEGIKPNSYEREAKDKLKNILRDKGIINKTDGQLNKIENDYVNSINEIIELLKNVNTVMPKVMQVIIKYEGLEEGNE
jgi:hypothetical protein